MKLKLIAVFFLSIDFCFAQPPDSWTQKADMATAGASARNRAVGISINGKGYIGTGWNNSTYFQGWWQYDPASDSWSGKANFPASARDRACGFTLNNMGFVSLGEDGSTNFVGLLRYNPITDVWDTMNNFPGNSRFSAAAFAVSGRAYVGAGTPDFGTTVYNTFYEWDPNVSPPKGTWTAKANIPGLGRFSGATFTIGNMGYVATGVGGGGIFLNDLWQYNPITNAWSQKANVPGPARAMAVGFSIGNKGYIGTGYTGSSTLNDMWEYNPLTNFWVQRANFGGGNRCGAVAFTINGKAYIGTGSAGYDQNFLSDLWEYTPLNNPPVQFQKTYGGTNADPDTLRMATGRQTADGGYIIASSSQSFSSKSAIYLVKTDNLGSVQWSHTYSSTVDDFGADIQQTTDGGYVFCGQYNNNAFTGKINSSGQMIPWANQLNGPSSANAIALNTDGSVLETGTFMGSLFVADFNPAGGSLQWGRTFGSTGNEGFSINRMASGNYIVGGQSLSTSAGSFLVISPQMPSAAAALNLSSSGNINAHVFASETQDGNFIFAGTTSVGSSPPDIFVAKTTTTTVTSTWANKYGASAKPDVVRCIIPTFDGGYAVAGFTQSFGFGNNDAFLMKLDAGGNFLWSREYGGTNDDRANNVIETDDGGFALFGYTKSFGKGNSDVWFIKTDSVGNVNCNEQSTSIPQNFFSVAATGTLTSSGLSSPTNTTPAVGSPTVQPTQQCLSCTFPIQKNKTDVKCYSVCTGSATVFAAGAIAPITYNWSTSPVQTTQTATGLCAQIYTVTVVDGNGCSATDTIAIHQPPPLTATVSPTANICKGNSTTIGVTNVAGGTPPYTFAWWAPAPALSCTTCPTPTASPTSSTTYTVQVLDSNLCSVAPTITVTVHQPTVNAGGDKTICPAQAITIGSSPINGMSYAWNPVTGLNNSTIANPAASPAATTTYIVTGTDASSCTNSDTVVVTVAPSPTVSIFSSASSSGICSGSSATLTASTNGNSYSWNTGATNSSISVSPTSTSAFSVTVTNSNSCTATATTTITVFPKPVPTFSVTNVSCASLCNGKAVATPFNLSSPPYTYSWSTVPAQTAQTASGLCAGNYSVFITDGKSCTATGTTAVTQPAALTATVSSTNAGCGCNGTAAANPAGGTSPYTYLWNTSATTSAINNLCAGNFSVTVKDMNGCSTLKTFTITSSPSVNVNASAVNDSICNGTSTTLNATVSGNPPNISYNWNPGNFSGSVVAISPTSNTTYTVIATNTLSPSCADTTTIAIAVIATPTITVSSNVTICKGNSATLTASGGNFYSWSSGQTVNQIIVSPTTNTTYTVTASNTVPAICTSKKIISVTVVSSPSASISAQYDTICTGIAIDTLIAGGGITYLWNTGQTKDTIAVAPQTPGNYTYTVQAINGSCSGTATVSIHVKQGPATPIVSPASAAFCIGDSILPFNANSPPLVLWVNAANGQLLGSGNIYQPPQNLAVGTYTAYAVEYISKSCISSPATALLTVNPLPVADAGNDITVCAGHSALLTASGGNNYYWIPGTYLNDSTVFNPTSTPDSTISYEVIVTDANNCQDKDTVTVHAIVSDTCGIHIFNVLSPNGDGANDEWVIDGINFFPDNSVEIYNRWGGKVWSSTHYDNKKIVWRGQNQQGQPLPAGTYYYVVDVTGLGRFSKWVELLR